MDAAALASWVGRDERADDDVSATPLAAWAALRDREPLRPAPGTPIPLLSHWFYCRPLYRQSTLAADGHVARGDFLPPIDLPRRMWAGSRFVFHAPVRVGERLTRRSSVLSIRPTEGRSGPLVFVRVGHRLLASDRLAIEEEHDIVYRAMPRPGDTPAPPRPAPPDAQWRDEIRPDATLLFRYSALTFNSHRIHYDRPYTMGTEGYPGLVVHGPLMGTLLVEGLARRHGQDRVARYAFKAMRPVFDIAPFFVCGRVDGESARMWIEDVEGQLCMEGEATLRPA